MFAAAADARRRNLPGPHPGRRHLFSRRADLHEVALSDPQLGRLVHPAQRDGLEGPRIAVADDVERDPRADRRRWRREQQHGPPSEPAMERPPRLQHLQRVPMGPVPVRRDGDSDVQGIRIDRGRRREPGPGEHLRHGQVHAVRSVQRFPRPTRGLRHEQGRHQGEHSIVHPGVHLPGICERVLHLRLPVQAERADGPGGRNELLQGAAPPAAILLREVHARHPPVLFERHPLQHDGLGHDHRRRRIRSGLPASPDFQGLGFHPGGDDVQVDGCGLRPDEDVHDGRNRRERDLREHHHQRLCGRHAAHARSRERARHEHPYLPREWDMFRHRNFHQLLTPGLPLFD